MSQRSEHHEQMTHLARDAFAEHVIAKTYQHAAEPNEDVAWLIRKPSGGSEYWAEIRALDFGHLLVYGDISTVMFAYDKASPRSRVAWIGGKDHVTDYIRQKAARGTDAGTMMAEWDLDVAREDVESMLKESEYGSPMVDEVRGIMRIAQEYEPASVILDRLYSTGVEAEDLCDIGMVFSARLYYAHAAIARLNNLLKEKLLQASRA